ncbi:hypothetical protein KL930_003471 [Ogataea haglerorum]|uniref:Pre-mRNA-splicing factor n=1 Tax=Ogataea haglerorum TaxID=1937702 RepID=A0AAN6D6Q2_9ASCO|nr:uncharacterized protein KL911_003063 [Ogataea haglerorum]KAG7695474.1 hypothetical protein KL915_002864 [Ogataea haglerorum]KAG7695803.1 hypothetical protein KL951_003328 [Ogataea haglerorum]KAG7705773.1 hypothetical protein KL914_003611 [Ogataea haglerorum]KAG7707209.1 hypothetical protein KL950_002869 [Ogataea haglerorum]KAG7718497.1 hypothetical protein KL913_002492 [Ogataea haglerorum]
MNFSTKKPAPKVGFSLKKKSTSLKRNELFEDEENKDTKIEISNVDDIRHKKDEPLVIKPIIKQDGWEARRRERTERENKELHYGLNKRDTERPQATGSRLLPPKSTESQDGEVPTLKSYEKMPVEKFGEAMLRGMGWKGSGTRSKTPVSKPRPPYLGLGAKPSPAQQGRAYKLDTNYVPVVKKEDIANSRERSPARDQEYRERGD